MSRSRCARIVAIAVLQCLGNVAAVAAGPPQQLANQYGCLACHGLVNKRVGPGFAQVAARYRDDRAAPAQLAAKIRNGSVGNWGRVVMPGQAQVSEADAQALAGWVLSQPSPR